MFDKQAIGFDSRRKEKINIFLSSEVRIPSLCELYPSLPRGRFESDPRGGEERGVLLTRLPVADAQTAGEVRFIGTGHKEQAVDPDW